MFTITENTAVGDLHIGTPFDVIAEVPQSPALIIELLHLASAVFSAKEMTMAQCACVCLRHQIETLNARVLGLFIA